jgi:hypothetical protein
VHSVDIYRRERPAFTRPTITACVPEKSALIVQNGRVSKAAACRVPALFFSSGTPLCDVSRFQELTPQLVTGQTLGAGQTGLIYRPHGGSGFGSRKARRSLGNGAETCQASTGRMTSEALTSTVTASPGIWRARPPWRRSRDSQIRYSQRDDWMVLRLKLMSRAARLASLSAPTPVGCSPWVAQIKLDVVVVEQIEPPRV